MNISPKAGPSLANSHAAPSETAVSARERAIARLSGNNSIAQEHPVQNPSSVSPEEMTAVKSPSQESERKHISEGEPATLPVDSEKPSIEATKPDEEPLSSQYANLARKEKALRAKAQAQEQALKAREAALQAREEAIKSKDSEYQSKYISKDRLSQDPLSTLSELGLTYDQLTNLALNAPKPEDVARAQELQSLKDEIKALKDHNEKSSKSQEEGQKNAYKQAVDQIRSEATQLVSANPEFETIKETGSINDVVDLIEQTFKQDGVLLGVEEAAKMVEDYLIEEAMKIFKISKIKNKFQSAPATPTTPVKTPGEPVKQQQTMKTLTNNISSSRQLSARERAILAFKGENKN